MGRYQWDHAALRIFEQTRDAAHEIVQRKKATYYAIGLGPRSIVEAVLRDQHTVMTISGPLEGQYGVTDISISMPAIVGRRGVEDVLNLPLSESELDAFQNSAQILNARFAETSSDKDGQDRRDKSGSSGGSVCDP